MEFIESFGFDYWISFEKLAIDILIEESLTGPTRMSDQHGIPKVGTRSIMVDVDESSPACAHLFLRLDVDYLERLKLPLFGAAPSFLHD